MSLGFDPRYAPNGPAEVDRSHPLAQGLVLELPWFKDHDQPYRTNLVDGSRGSIVDLRCTTAITADQTGIINPYNELEERASLADKDWYPTNPLSGLLSASIQIVGTRYLTPALNGQYVIGYTGSSPNRTDIVWKRDSVYGNVIYFSAQGSNFRYWVGWNAINVRESNVLSYIAGTGGALYRDGALVSVTATAGSHPGIPTQNAKWYRFADGMGLSLFRLWNRALSADEAAQISAEPWSFWRPIRQITYFIPEEEPVLEPETVECLCTMPFTSGRYQSRGQFEYVSDYYAHPNPKIIVGRVGHFNSQRGDFRFYGTDCCAVEVGDPETMYHLEFVGTHNPVRGNWEQLAKVPDCGAGSSGGDGSGSSSGDGSSGDSSGDDDLPIGACWVQRRCDELYLYEEIPHQITFDCNYEVEFSGWEIVDRERFEAWLGLAPPFNQAPGAEQPCRLNSFVGETPLSFDAPDGVIQIGVHQVRGTDPEPIGEEDCVWRAAFAASHRVDGELITGPGAALWSCGCDSSREIDPRGGDCAGMVWPIIDRCGNVNEGALMYVWENSLYFQMELPLTGNPCNCINVCPGNECDSPYTGFDPFPMIYDEEVNIYCRGRSSVGLCWRPGRGTSLSAYVNIPTCSHPVVTISPTQWDNSTLRNTAVTGFKAGWVSIRRSA